MKKFVMGLIIGMALMLSLTAYADEIESYIGKVIEGQFPVIVDGNEVEKLGIVVDGTTYLPVRAAAELFGYDVSFVDSQVILKKMKYVSIIGEPVKMGDDEMNEDQLEKLNKRLNDTKDRLQEIQDYIQSLEDDPNIPSESVEIAKKVRQPVIDNLEATIIDLEKQIEELTTTAE